MGLQQKRSVICYELDTKSPNNEDFVRQLFLDIYCVNNSKPDDSLVRVLRVINLFLPGFWDQLSPLMANNSWAPLVVRLHVNHLSDLSWNGVTERGDLIQLVSELDAKSIRYLLVFVGVIFSAIAIPRVDHQTVSALIQYFGSRLNLDTRCVSFLRISTMLRPSHDLLNHLHQLFESSPELRNNLFGHLFATTLGDCIWGRFWSEVVSIGDHLREGQILVQEPWVPLNASTKRHVEVNPEPSDPFKRYKV